MDYSKRCLHPTFDPYKTGSFRPCRKCPECLRRKRWTWYFKGLRELDTWPRTWFITLTFSRIPTEPYKEVQKWLKRIRKNNKGKIKFLCTTEYGSKNGRLHYHLLVHCEESLKRRDVELKWSMGFSKATLVSKQLVKDADTKRRSHNREISYVTKYLLKDSQKLRASQQYGKGYENIPF
ncbi:MAG: putative replication initiation protein [Inoviridae sp.]|nr:MAG: putative replication initiation protein [Inoviridae sp.]